MASAERNESLDLVNTDYKIRAGSAVGQRCTVRISVASSTIRCLSAEFLSAVANYTRSKRCPLCKDFGGFQHLSLPVRWRPLRLRQLHPKRMVSPLPHKSVNNAGGAKITEVETAGSKTMGIILEKHEQGRSEIPTHTLEPAVFSTRKPGTKLRA